MSKTHRYLQALAFLFILSPACSFATGLELRNATTIAAFGPDGLLSVENLASHSGVGLARDAWSIVIDTMTLRSTGVQPEVRKVSDGEIAYTYDLEGYRVEVTYRLEPDWRFIGKQIRVLRSPNASFVVHRVVSWDMTAQSAVDSDFVPSIYTPQFGASIEESRKHLPGKDFGEFLRFAGNEGAMLTVQNPYLEVQRNGQSVTIAYAPEMEWHQSWGDFKTDTACIGAYRLSGRLQPREMVLEWHLPPARMRDDGMDETEVAAFTDCVRAFLVHPSPAPINVEVGWTLNDYQIDVGMETGRTEYKRIIDTASELGIHTLLYAPGNSKLSDRTECTDAWGWEYVLWLGLGEKIRKGEWDPAKDPIPPSVSKMISYAKQKQIGLLAYVYPSVPYATNPTWLVKRPGRRDGLYTYASLASRKFQDYLIRNLIVFQKRTGIVGYSFDYTLLNLPGSSSYAQWYGWRRVMETLRKADPSIVIDGRQSYQTYGPWIWLSGSYPHPMGGDEQPESFKPFPDLHFDRVSADRGRFVNYWYRNYQFAPEEIIPGSATHQTERSRAVVGANGRRDAEMMYTRYRVRDWDYLGFKYSFISSIATGGWNNVIEMIPARDPEEARHFSAEDKAWIHDWIAWTVKNKEYLRNTRNILDQPALGHVDGTSAIVGDRGYLFLFNPNYKQMSARFRLDSTIGLSCGKQFFLREIFPQQGRLLGKPGAGVWSQGDQVQLQLDGTSATVIELEPAGSYDTPLLLNAASALSGPKATVKIGGTKLMINNLTGEPGTAQKIGVLLPREIEISSVQVNGRALAFKKTAAYVEVPVEFAGARFAQAQEIQVTRDGDGSLTGSFLVPRRVLDELASRKSQWPIPWTPEDYESTWLVPDRLLLFIQFGESSDSTPVTVTLDGQPLILTPAYSSSRVDVPCFVGFYADLSRIMPDLRHTIRVRMPNMTPGQFQGIFFDNVLPQFTQLLGSPLIGG